MRYLRFGLITLLLAGIIFIPAPLTSQAVSPGEWGVTSPGFNKRAQTEQTAHTHIAASGLLVNGNFEEVPYYWQVPNHWVAGGWHRWWTETSPTMPEFEDLRPWSPPAFDGVHAQVYFKWGPTYEAGIYQEVEGLTPCTPYRMTMWTRNDSLDGVLPHARIGLDPQGTQLTSRVPLGPEDEYSIVHGGMPPLTVWSQEQSALFTWEQLAVEAEPLGSKLTAILYAYPERPDDDRTYYFTTFWDGGGLHPVTFTGGRLPAPQNWNPSGFIVNPNLTSTGNSLVVEWQTLSPASSQVWYDIIPPTTPVSPTVMSHTTYLPVIARAASTYLYATPLETTPTTTHRAVISGLEAEQTVQLILLSRRPLTESCVTEIHGPLEITIGTTANIQLASPSKTE